MICRTLGCENIATEDFGHCKACSGPHPITEVVRFKANLCTHKIFDYHITSTNPADIFLSGNGRVQEVMDAFCMVYTAVFKSPSHHITHSGSVSKIVCSGCGRYFCWDDIYQLDSLPADWKTWLLTNFHGVADYPDNGVNVGLEPEDCKDCGNPIDDCACFD